VPTSSLNGSPGAPPVTYECADGVATITFARPEAMNSLDTATKISLLEAVRKAAEDTQARAVILTGSGRAFCVGQDLKEHSEDLAAGNAALGHTVLDHYNPTVNTLVTMPKPVIAAVNGVAAGAGVSYAMACDLRIVADTARFNLAFAGIALSCDTGSSWTLPRLVGWAKARELLLFPRTVPATEALELGLVTEVVPADDLAARAGELAAQLAAGPTVAYSALRQSLEFSASHTFEESLAFEAAMMQLTGATSDHRAAVEAFLGKRTPTFRGR
jgi:2-(1,2-epoxy-1,2-dihydrophenyl)acetyl-CoA isomerase